MLPASITAPSDRQVHLNPSSDGSQKHPASVGPGSMHSTSGAGAGAGRLNDRLNVEFIDVPEEDSSIGASVTRGITSQVGKCCTPRQMLVVLRILKALTFSFLVFTIAADLMYIVFVELIASSEVNTRLGGFRDTTIRVYGIILTVMAILIELDVTRAVKHFSGLKGFIPRALLLFFIATITNAHPLHTISETEEVEMNDDDYAQDDELYVGDDDFDNTGVSVPSSTVVFQLVTSFTLAICACTYFVLGVLCFDRFTAKAFLSDSDPLVSTAIPHQTTPPHNTEIHTPYSRT